MTTTITADEVSAAFGSATVAFLGSGSFGETWQICAMEVNGVTGDYAVKILHADQFNLRLVDRETAGLRKFDSDGIVRLLDVRDVAFEGETRTVLVCEYLEGGSVGYNLQNAAPPTIEEVVAFACGLMGTIDELHSVDVIHRDIKPENVILRDGDWARPVLIDFGLSRGIVDETFTAYPARVGTLAYVARTTPRGESP